MKKIRLWKLGSCRDGIVPTAKALENLQTKIDKLVGEEKDVINFVWGDDLTIEEYTGEPGVLKAARIGFTTAVVKPE